MTALAAVLLLAAARAEEPAILIEFDGKAGRVPSSPAPGKVEASGTFTLPPGAEFGGVEVEVFRLDQPAIPRLLLTATVDTTAIPARWSIKSKDGSEPLAGIYHLSGRLKFAVPEGPRVAETWDIRKVVVKPVGK